MGNEIVIGAAVAKVYRRRSALPVMRSPGCWRRGALASNFKPVDWCMVLDMRASVNLQRDFPFELGTSCSLQALSGSFPESYYCFSKLPIAKDQACRVRWCSKQRGSD